MSVIINTRIGNERRNVGDKNIWVCVLYWHSKHDQSEKGFHIYCDVL
jgi:hypothetical protein